MTDAPTPLDPTEVAALRRDFPRLLRAEVQALPAEILRWHPGPAEWCVPETLGHLIATEQVTFADRIRPILGSPDARIASYDPAAATRDRPDCGRDLSELLKRFAALREESAAFVARLSAEDLERSGRHDGVGPITVGDLLHEWVYHDRDHLRQIMANVQQFVWPHLGNTRLFYTG
jgi:DinB superfamily